MFSYVIENNMYLIYRLKYRQTFSFSKKFLMYFSKMSDANLHLVRKPFEIPVKKANTDLQNKLFFSTKHGRILIRVPLRMPVRKQNFSTSAGQNPPTCPENYPQQNQSRKNSANAKK